MRLTDLLKDKSIEIFVYIHEIKSYFYFFTMQNLEKKKKNNSKKKNSIQIQLYENWKKKEKLHYCMQKYLKVPF